MSQLTFRHDHFFKHALQILEVAQEHVQDYLPPSLTRQLALETLQLDKTAYLSDKLRETRSDLTYACQLNNGAPLRIALLHEHKSEQPERDVRFQILNYKTGIWQVNEAQEQAPAFVLPSVIYHGRKKWVKAPFSASFPGLPAEFFPYLAEFEFVLTNLRELTDEDILQRSRGKLVASAFLAMKHAFQPKYFKQNFVKVVNFDWQGYTRQTWELFLKGLLYYIASLTNFTHQEFQQIAKPLPSDLNHFAMFTMQSILDEGIEIGRKEGREEGIEKGIEIGAMKKQTQFVLTLLHEFPTWADEKIANLASVEKEFVAKLRKELSNKQGSGKNRTKS